MIRHPNGGAAATEEARLAPATLPWTDREALPRDRRAAAPSPRSEKDSDILRALARRINPRDAGAHNNLGVVFYNKGLYDEAATHFETALELDPGMVVAERNLHIAYFGTGHFERMVSLLRDRIAADPEDHDLRLRLARALYHGGDAAAAIAELDSIIEHGRAGAGTYQWKARAELRRGRDEAAHAALREAAALEPRSARVQLQIGEILFHRGLMLDARKALEQAVELDPALGEAYHLLAYVYGDIGEEEAATKASERANTLNPALARTEPNLSLDSHSPARYEELVGERGARPVSAESGALAHYNLGLAFRHKALFDEALREFRLALEHGEDRMLVQQAHAEMLLLKGAPEEAASIYETLVEQEVASPKLWNELGVALHQLGRIDVAMDAYRRALELEPRYALAWNNLGVAQQHTGDAAAASASLRQALELERAVADVACNLALLLHRAGRLREADEMFRRALDDDPDSGPAWTGLGMVLLELGRADEARGVLMTALEIDPDAAAARYHLAFALSALGDYQGALRETRRALDQNPIIPPPQFRLLIDVQFEETSVPAPDLDLSDVVSDEPPDRFEFEADALAAVFDAPPPPAAAQTERARTLLAAASTALERGQLDEAYAAAQRALSAGAARTEVMLLQGEVLLRRGLPGEAVERFENVLHAIASGQDTGDGDGLLRQALFGAARALFGLDRMQAAIDAAERLCALMPGDVEALLTLGQALARVEDYARAVIALEEARRHAPDHVSLLTELGRVYLDSGDAESGEAALRRALSVSDGAVAARTALGRLLWAQGRLEEAAAEFRSALDLLPSYGEAALTLAALEAEQGRPNHAVIVLVDLLVLDPYHIGALLRLAGLLEEMGRSAEARVAYRRVLRIEATNVEALAAVERLSELALVE
jgi:cellulose synthase operon protein C